MSKYDYDNELKKCFYNENLLRYKKLNDLAIKASREEVGYQEKQNEKMRRFKEDNAFWLKPSKKIVEVKEIVMKYDKKSDKFVKEELDEKIDDFVQDIIDYRNEVIIENKKNKETALKEKVKDQKITNFQCECGCYLIRKDGMARHQKTTKHEKLMALKVLNDQMIKSMKIPPVGPVKIKAPTLGGEISYISVQKSRK